jgi:hypothetical protein
MLETQQIIKKKGNARTLQQITTEAQNIWQIQSKKSYHMLEDWQ